MDWFAQRGFVCWCVDMEGYGRSDKTRDIHCDIANGADDLAAATDYIARARGVERFMTYGISSGRAARGAVRRAPSRARGATRARRVRVDRRRRADARAAAQEAARVPRHEAPADRSRVRPFDLRARSSRLRRTARRRRVRRRDPRARRLDAQRHLHRHVLASCRSSIRARSRCRRSSCAASTTASPRFDDLIEFFKRLPNPDKQFTVMAGHLARELPAEELPDGLPHPARVVHASRAGLSLSARP